MTLHLEGAYFVKNIKNGRGKNIERLQNQINEVSGEEELVFRFDKQVYRARYRPFCIEADGTVVCEPVKEGRCPHCWALTWVPAG